jgi:Fe-S cluster assembly protein DRE2 N-terminus
MPPFLDPASLNDMAGVTPTAAISKPQSPILILSPSSLSYRVHILETLLTSSPQLHDLQMLDRIALNFAYLPPSHYSEAILAPPSTEEKVGEVGADYRELKAVLGKSLSTMQPGGRIRIGAGGTQLSKDAILGDFLVETENQEVPASPNVRH